MFTEFAMQGKGPPVGGRWGKGRTSVFTPMPEGIAYADAVQMSVRYEAASQLAVRGRAVAGRAKVMSQCGMPVAILLPLPEGAVESQVQAGCQLDTAGGKVVDVMCLRAHTLGSVQHAAQFWFLDYTKISVVGAGSVTSSAIQGGAAYVDSHNLTVYIQVTDRPHIVSWIDAETQLKCFARRVGVVGSFRHAAMGGPSAPAERLLEHSDTVRSAIILGASAGSCSDIRSNRTLSALTCAQMKEAEKKMSPATWTLFTEGYARLGVGRDWMCTVVIDETSQDVARATARREKLPVFLTAGTPGAELIAQAALQSMKGVLPLVQSDQGTQLLTTDDAEEQWTARNKLLAPEARKAEASVFRDVARGSGLLGEWRARHSPTGAGMPVGTKVTLLKKRYRDKKPPKLNLQGPIGSAGQANVTMKIGDLGADARYIETVEYTRMSDLAILTLEGAGEFGDLAFRELSSMLRSRSVRLDCYNVDSRSGDRASLVHCTASGSLLSGSTTIWQARPDIKGDMYAHWAGETAVLNHCLLAAAAMGENIRSFPMVGMAHASCQDIPGGEIRPPSLWGPDVDSWGDDLAVGRTLPWQLPSGRLQAAPFFGYLKYPGCTATVVDHDALRVRKKESLFSPGPPPLELPPETGVFLIGANADGESRTGFRVQANELHVFVASPSLGGYALAPDANIPADNPVDCPESRLLGDRRVGLHADDQTPCLKFIVRRGYVSEPVPVLVEHPAAVAYVDCVGTPFAAALAGAWGVDVNADAPMPALDLEAFLDVVKRQIDTEAALGQPSGPFGRSTPEIGAEDESRWAASVLANLADVRLTSAADFERFLPWCSRLDLASVLFDAQIRGADPRLAEFASLTLGSMDSGVGEALESRCFAVFPLGERVFSVDRQSGRVVIMVTGPDAPRAAYCQGKTLVDSSSRRFLRGHLHEMESPPDDPERGQSLGREVVRTASAPRVSFASGPSPWSAAFEAKTATH